MKTLDKPLVYLVTYADLDVSDLLTEVHFEIEEKDRFSLAVEKDLLTFSASLKGSELSKRLLTLGGKFPMRGSLISLEEYGAWLLELKELEYSFEKYLSGLEEKIGDGKVQVHHILRTFVKRYRSEFKSFLVQVEDVMGIAFQMTDLKSIND